MNAHARAQSAAQQLNRDCFCRSVDHHALRRALESGVGGAGTLSYDALRATHANLFSDVRVHVAQNHLDFMAELVRAVERVVARPAWQEMVLAYAPQIARHPARAAGVMLGYDFHLDADGPRLIEINTNAGGALLNTRLLAAQRACSADGLADASAALLASAERAQCADSVAVEADIVAMFRAEWALWTRREAGDSAPPYSAASRWSTKRRRRSSWPPSSSSSASSSSPTASPASSSIRASSSSTARRCATQGGASTSSITA